jgi:hypothetical protein
MRLFLPKEWHIIGCRSECETIERITVIYARGNIEAIVIAKEIDLGYIHNKVVIYCEMSFIEPIQEILSGFTESRVKLQAVTERLVHGLKRHLKTDDVSSSVDVEFKSENKNKSSRDKRLLMSLGCEHFEKVVINVGEKKVKYLRKRPKRADNHRNVSSEEKGRGGE